MNVLSLFDGISCGQMALSKLGIKVDNYYACEIKDIAIKVTQHNFPHTKQLGSVTELDVSILPKIDLLIGGSPCQDLSVAMKDRQGTKGEKSKLFFEFVRVLREVKPKYFLLENVARMKKEDKDIISKEMGVEPIRINSSLLSAQLRDRFYWTNIPNVDQPKDKYIPLSNIIESGWVDRQKSRALLVSDSRPLTTQSRMWHRYKNTGFTTVVFEGNGGRDHTLRYFTQKELERLQTLPDGYTSILTRNQSANVLGDCWTVDVICHILKNMEVPVCQ